MNPILQETLMFYGDVLGDVETKNLCCFMLRIRCDYWWHFM